MRAVPLERTRMLSFWLEFEEPCKAAYSVAGMIREADATAMREDIVDATVSLNFCSVRVSPPAKKQQPKTCKPFSYPAASDLRGLMTHQQDVGQNTAEHAALHDSDLSFLQRNNADLFVSCKSKLQAWRSVYKPYDAT